MTDVIFVSRRPEALVWGLGPLVPPEGEVVLMTWTGGPSSHDASLAPSVARTMARALSTLWRLSFRLPYEEAERLRSAGLCEPKFLRPGSSRLARLLRPSEGVPVSTVDAGAVLALLADPGWSLGGQVAILTDISDDAPALAAGDFADLTGDDWLERLSSFSGTVAQGALRPGVDGNVAALFLTRTDAVVSFLEELSGQAETEGVAFQELSETELTQRLAQMR